MAETTFTKLLSAQMTAGATLDQVLLDTIRADLDYLKDHLVRTGTSGTGQGLIVARGKEFWTGTTDSNGDADITVTVTFSTGSTDGNPSFNLTNTIESMVFSLEEYTGGSGSAWPAIGSADPNQKMNVYYFYPSPVYIGAGANVQLNDWGGTTTYEGYLHWMAFMRE